MDKGIKKSGFTLIEVMISMSIISILFVGVHDAILIIIKYIEYGEQKQISAVIGGKICEDIHQAVRNDLVKNDSYIGLIISENITLKASNKDFKYEGIFYFDKSGKEEYYENESKYKAVITMEPKKTFEEGLVEIDDNDMNNHHYKLNKTDKKIVINIDNNILKIIRKNREKSTYNFDEKNNNIYLDFSESRKHVNLNVNNESEIDLNLYIVNSSFENEYMPDINNIGEGHLNLIYKSEKKNLKEGMLFMININVYNKSDELLYEGNFVQNIDTDY